MTSVDANTKTPKAESQSGPTTGANSHEYLDSTRHLSFDQCEVKDPLVFCGKSESELREDLSHYISKDFLGCTNNTPKKKTPTNDKIIAALSSQKESFVAALPAFVLDNSEMRAQLGEESDEKAKTAEVLLDMLVTVAKYVNGNYALMRIFVVYLLEAIVLKEHSKENNENLRKKLDHKERQDQIIDLLVCLFGKQVDPKTIQSWVESYDALEVEAKNKKIPEIIRPTISYGWCEMLGEADNKLALAPDDATTYFGQSQGPSPRDLATPNTADQGQLQSQLLTLVTNLANASAACTQASLTMLEKQGSCPSDELKNIGSELVHHLAGVAQNCSIVEKTLHDLMSVPVSRVLGMEEAPQSQSAKQTEFTAESVMQNKWVKAWFENFLATEKGTDHLQDHEQELHKAYVKLYGSNYESSVEVRTPDQLACSGELWDRSSVQYTSIRGSGTYGCVLNSITYYPPHDQKNCDAYSSATKFSTHTDLQQVSIWLRSLLVIGKLDHENIAMIYSFFCFNLNKGKNREQTQVYITASIQERGEGTLEDELESRQKAFKSQEKQQLSKDHIKWMVKAMFHMVSAVKYLHENNCIHRDLKPTNVIYTRDNSYKLIDFDQIRPDENEHSGMHDKSYKNVDPDHIRLEDNEHSDDVALKTKDVGTPFYEAPELGTGRYTSKVDVYSLGVVCCELITLEHPSKLTDKLKRNPKKEVVGNYEKLFDRFKERFDKESDAKWWAELVSSMCQWDPDERCTAEQVFEKLENRFEDLHGTKSSMV